MANPLKVLFAVDFKAGSEKAIRDLTALAKTHPMSITLLSVYHEARFAERDSLYPAAALKQDEAMSKIKFSLEDKLDEWATKHLDGVTCQKLIEFGEPAQVFSKLSTNYDLLVMGSNPHGIIDKVFMNSVAESIVGRTHKPTIILRKGLAQASEATVLVDLGDHPKEVVRGSVELAKNFGLKKLNFVSYYPMPLEVSALTGSGSTLYTNKEFTQLLEQLKDGLNNIVKAEAGDIDSSVAVKKVTASSLASDIADDFANTTQPVIIGRKRRSLLSQFFLGSVAIGLMRTVKSDLVILPVE